jgi:hypothetical protein
VPLTAARQRTSVREYQAAEDIPGPQRIPTPEGIMFGQIARMLPFIIAGLLLLNLLTAIADGSRGNWLAVAIVAILLALMLWRRGRVVDIERHP